MEAIKTDEATAEIEGWNTHVDYMKSKPDIKPDGSKVEPTLLNIAKAYSNAHLLFEDDGWRFSGNEPKFKLELKGQNNAEYMLDGGRQDTAHGMGELFFENNGQFCQDNNIQLDAALNYRNRVAVSGLDIISSIENSLPRNSNETVVINMKDLGIDAEKILSHGWLNYEGTAVKIEDRSNLSQMTLRQDQSKNQDQIKPGGNQQLCGQAYPEYVLHGKKHTTIQTGMPQSVNKNDQTPASFKQTLNRISMHR